MKCRNEFCSRETTEEEPECFKCDELRMEAQWEQEQELREDDLRYEQKDEVDFYG